MEKKKKVDEWKQGYEHGREVIKRYVLKLIKPVKTREAFGVSIIEPLYTAEQVVGIVNEVLEGLKEQMKRRL